MAVKEKMIMAVLVVTVGVGLGGCLALQKGKLLASPSSANKVAARHNDEGIEAYKLGQAPVAKEHFEAAISASPTLAEAHYNLGMVLYKMGQEDAAYPHFMKAANLEPGNDVIQSAPPLRGIQRPSGGGSGPAMSDGHSHTH